MAIKIVNTIHNYIGLSTDTKPTDTSVSVGSKLTEINTGKIFIYDGSNWVEDLTLIYAMYTALHE